MSNPKAQAAALAEEFLMHLEDECDDAGDEGKAGFELKDQDTDEAIGVVTQIAASAAPNRFRVKLADGTTLLVTVEVE